MSQEMIRGLADHSLHQLYDLDEGLSVKELARSIAVRILLMCIRRVHVCLLTFFLQRAYQDQMEKPDKLAKNVIHIEHRHHLSFLRVLSFLFKRHCLLRYRGGLVQNLK